MQYISVMMVATLIILYKRRCFLSRGLGQPYLMLCNPALAVARYNKSTIWPNEKRRWTNKILVIWNLPWKITRIRTQNSGFGDGEKIVMRKGQGQRRLWGL